MAVVEICCGQFKALSFGNSDRVKVGEDVIAIGYPLNIRASATVTKGIVSATRYEGYWSAFVIQTDAPINPGNSGGPLLSIDGRVVGINTASNDYSSDGRPVDGVGWAIAEESIQQVALDLQGGKRTGGATATPVPTVIAVQGRWWTYTNQQYRYEIQVPPNWTVDDSDPVSVVLASPGRYATVKVFKPDWNIPSAAQELRDWMAELGKQYPVGYKIVNFDSWQEHEGEIATVWFEGQEDAQYCSVKGHQALIVPNNGWNSTWILVIVCERDADYYLPTILQIITTVQQR